jgi:predicted site-specific integrase-resolvase
MRRVKISKYAKEQGVTYRTIWNWCKAGKLIYEKGPTNTLFILVDEKINPINEKVIVYCRVSSSENKSNLESQKQRCLNFCAARGLIVSEAVVEIGSGLNDKREKLRKIFADQTVKTIVVEHKDRLARFGTTMLEDLLKLQNREILYINEAEDSENDLMQDFVSIITSFCARIYGQRRCKRKTEKIIEELQNNE